MKDMKEIFLIFVISRVWILSILSWFGSPAENHIYLTQPFLDRFVLYDSENYAVIAKQGYIEERLTVFFPVYPLLVRFLSWFGLDIYYAGILLSNVFFFVSLYLLKALWENAGMEKQVIRFGLWSLALFPTSFFFSAMYSESLFLGLVLMTFWLWRRGYTVTAYAMAGLAGMTRLIGAVVPFSLLIEALLYRGIKKKDVFGTALASLLMVLYPLYLWVTRGTPLLFLKAQSYYHRVAGWPFESLLRELQWWPTKDLTSISLTLIHFILVILVFYYLVLQLQEKTMTVSEMIYLFVGVMIPLSSVLNLDFHIATHGFVRYLLPLFPFFFSLGNHLHKLRTNRLGFSVAILLWFIMSWFIYFHLSYKGFVA